MKEILKQRGQKNKKERGITLIALVITIIVLLILAGVTIAAITGENGIIINANNAKEKTEIAEEKEIVDRATIQAMRNNKRGNILRDKLQDELDRITKVGDTEVDENGDEFNVLFVNTNRYYIVDKDGNIIEEGKIVVDKSPGDITKDENGNDIEEGQAYEIWCIEDLMEWSKNYQNYQNTNINLCTNLDFKSKYSYANSERIDFGDINEDGETNTLIQEMQEGTGFKPIYQFNGIFDGKGQDIKNIYINYPETRGIGFFQNTSDATIINFTISGNIIGKNNVGGIIRGKL